MTETGEVQAEEARAEVGGLWSPQRRRLTVGLVLNVTLVASESLAVETVLPMVSDDLGGLSLYGWVFSAFFLGSLLGIVLAGRMADRRGPALPCGLGLGLFAVGLVAGGLAPSMLALVVARAVQGLGAGAIPAVAYATIGRTLPEELRPRMFAFLSSAWVIPGLAGPALSGLVGDAFGWRWVFLGLLPIVGLAAALSVPALRSLAPVGGRDTGSPLRPALALVVGSGLLLAGLGSSRPLTLAAATATGVAIGVPALRRLVPQGTLAARPGLPSTVLIRGVITFALFGAGAFVPLTLQSVRGTSASVAGLALTASALAWTAGAWVQERRMAAWGPVRLIRIGFALLLVGIPGVALALVDGVPIAVGVAGWATSGLAMGFAYAPIAQLVLRHAEPGREGTDSAALQLSDVLGVALGTGVGGALVAYGDRVSWAASTGIGLTFALTTTVAALGLLLTRRLDPARL